MDRMPDVIKAKEERFRFRVCDSKNERNDQASEVEDFPREGLLNGDQPSSHPSAGGSKNNHAGDENKSKQRYGKSLKKEKQGIDPMRAFNERLGVFSTFAFCWNYYLCSHDAS